MEKPVVQEDVTESLSDSLSSADGDDLVSFAVKLLSDQPNLLRNVTNFYRGISISSKEAERLLNDALTNLRNPTLYGKKALLIMYWEDNNDDGKADSEGMKDLMENVFGFSVIDFK